MFAQVYDAERDSQSSTVFSEDGIKPASCAGLILTICHHIAKLECESQILCRFCALEGLRVQGGFICTHTESQGSSESRRTRREVRRFPLS